MFSANPTLAAPWIRGLTTALVAAGVYLLIARSVDPFNPHWPAASVIGATLGLHIYRRARWRTASKPAATPGGTE